MADFDLTLTGEQVQQRLNLVPQHAEAIAAIQEAIKAFVNLEQVQHSSPPLRTLTDNHRDECRYVRPSPRL